MNILNATPHAIRFQDTDGYVIEIEPSGFIANATPVEEPVRIKNGIMFVRTKFVPDEKTEEELAFYEANIPGVIVVGSIIAAQAFPGRIFAMVPVKGFERVPPEEKRMRLDKFTTFEE
jgi:hypothetical protein